MLVLRTQAKISKKMLSDDQLKCVFHAVDTDQSGEVDLEEFTTWVNREMEAAQDPDKEKALREKMRVRCWQRASKAHLVDLDVHTTSLCVWHSERWTRN